MNASVLQQTIGNTDAGVAAFCTVAYGSNISAGSTGLCIVAFNSFLTITSLIDSNSNNWGSPLQSVTDSTQHITMALYALPNMVAGALSLTANINTATQQLVVWPVEVGGVTTSPVDGFNGADQVSPGTVADALSSGNITPLNQPNLLVSFCADIGPSTTTPSKHAAATLGISGASWSAHMLGAYISQSQRLTSTNPVAGTFTATTGTDHFLTMGIILDEIVAQTLPPYAPPTQFFVNEVYLQQ